MEDRKRMLEIYRDVVKKLDVENTEPYEVIKKLRFSKEEYRMDIIDAVLWAIRPKGLLFDVTLEEDPDTDKWKIRLRDELDYDSDTIDEIVEKLDMLFWTNSGSPEDNIRDLLLDWDYEYHEYWQGIYEYLQWVDSESMFYLDSETEDGYLIIRLLDKITEE